MDSIFGKISTMPPLNQPKLTPGRVYRTREFRKWGANAPRLAKRLFMSGTIIPLAHGLFAVPKRSRFGPVPPADDEVIRAFLSSTQFLFTGPDRWNALGLGTTALWAMPLVYNTKRSGTFTLGGRRFMLKRVAFPAKPPPEWFVVDLLENADLAGVSRSDLAGALQRALRAGSFDGNRLREMAKAFGTRKTQQLVESCLAATN